MFCAKRVTYYSMALHVLSISFHIGVCTGVLGVSLLLLLFLCCGLGLSLARDALQEYVKIAI